VWSETIAERRVDELRGVLELQILHDDSARLIWSPDQSQRRTLPMPAWWYGEAGWLDGEAAVRLLDAAEASLRRPAPAAGWSTSPR